MCIRDSRTTRRKSCHPRWDFQGQISEALAIRGGKGHSACALESVFDVFPLQMHLSPQESVENISHAEQRRRWCKRPGALVGDPSEALPDSDQRSAAQAGGSPFDENVKVRVCCCTCLLYTSDAADDLTR